MIQRFVTILLSAACLILLSKPASASGGGIMTVGTITKEAATRSGSRELVDLVNKNGLLVARPKQGCIELITVYAPGCQDRNLILREIPASEGRTSLLISAPDILKKKTHRITIFVKPDFVNLVLVESSQGKWEYHNPEVLIVSQRENKGPLGGSLLAFSVGGPGLYWLQNSKAPTPDSTSELIEEASASSLLGGGAISGLWHWGWPSLLLLLGWGFSRLTHRIEEKEGS